MQRTKEFLEIISMTAETKNSVEKMQDTVERISQKEQ